MKIFTKIFCVTIMLGLLRTFAWGQAAGDFRSLTSGNWSATATWQRLNSDVVTWEAFGVGENTGTGIPASTSAVLIRDGHTITIDASPTVASFTVGEGASGILLFDRTTGRALTVTGNVTVAAGGSFLATDFNALTPTGDLTLLSTTITNVSSTAGIATGMVIGGNNFHFAGGTTVTAFDATTITVSAAPTVAGTTVPLTIQLPAITQTLTIGGNLINNGTFDMSKSVSTVNTSTTVCNVTFNNTSGDQTISGSTPVLTRFQGVTLAKSVVGNKVISSIDTYIGGSNNFILTAGTWNQHAGNLINGNGSKTLGVAAGKLLIDGTGGYSNYAGPSYQLPVYTSGSLTVSAGTFEVNTSGSVQIGVGNNSITTGGTINLLGGNIYLYGRLTITTGTTTINGANIYLDPNPSSSSGTNKNSALLTNAAALGATSATFEVTGSTASSYFNFLSGSVTLINPNAAATTGRDIKIAPTSSAIPITIISGGTIYIGDGSSTRISTGTVPGFLNGSSFASMGNNIVVQTGNTPGRNFCLNTTNLNLSGTGTLTVAANGVLDCAAKQVLGSAGTTFTLSSGATLKTNLATGINGIFPSFLGTNNLSTGANYEFYAGVAQVTGALLPATVHNLTVSTSSTVLTLTNSVTVSGTLSIASGTVANLGGYASTANTLSLGGVGQTSTGTWGATGSGATNINGTYFSGTGTVAVSNPLPVELTSFTAVAQSMNTQLKWSTATEVNNFGFDIERRAVASDAWAKVGFVPGAGTSNVAHHYTYADANLSAGKYAYRIKQIDNSGAFTYTASTEVTIAGMPKELKLYDNYPNPFNPSTKLQFTVAENGKVRLSVYNVLGQEVATLFNGAAEAGNLYTANFDASRMATGIYFSVLEYGNQRITHKMLMTK